MSLEIHSSWKDTLQEEFTKPYFKQLLSFVQSKYESKTIYPPQNKVFAAFDWCKWQEVKVVIIGQDPYHGPNQANGLCFSVSDEIAHPPSLVNIFKELKTDLGLDIPISGNLERWADQGVLMLNATLTVEAHQAGSHQKKGWETFTDAVIQKISNEKEGVVFLLWGGYAQKKGRKIDATKHHILKSGHPSPLSANRGFWFGNKHFSATNEYFRVKGEKEIEW